MTQLRQLIADLSGGAVAPKIGIYGHNLTTGKIIEHNADQVFGTASIIKVAIALALWEKARQGKIDLDAPLNQAALRVADLGKYTNGALAFLSPHTAVTLRLICFFMLRLSDNPATNVALSFVTQDEVNRYLKTWGFDKTQLTITSINPEQLEAEENYLGLTTPREMARIMHQVVKGETGEIQKMLESDYPVPTYNRYLPVAWNVTDSETKIKAIYAKGGSFPKFELLAESLVICTNKDEILCLSIFTQGILQKDGKKYPTNLHPDHPATLFIAKAVAMLFDTLA